MRARISLLIGAVVLGPLALAAQSPACSTGGIGGQDACQKAIDLYLYMAPQIGTVMAGGNATLGQGGTLGGFATLPFPHPKITLGFRVNAVAGSLPDVGAMTLSPIGAQASTIPIDDQILAGPAADLAIGLFKGFPLGLTNIGGLDLLVSALYLPEFEDAGVSLEVPDGPLRLGWGVRVGVIQESLALPGVSFTWLSRGLPMAHITGAVGTTQLRVDSLEMTTNSWRVVASKSFITFALAGGVGRDSYDSHASVSTSGIISSAGRVEQEISRTSYFLDIGMNLFVLKIIGELGMVSGGNVTTFNQWDGKQPDDSRFYGAIGMRLSF